MNAIISPAVAALDIALLERTDDICGPRPLPPIPASAFRNLQYKATYNGIAIFKLPSVGVYYSAETGCAWTIGEVREEIDAWHARLEDDRLTEGLPA